MICVYAPDCTDFTGNGLTVLQPLVCEVTETLNGEWELSLEHLIDERGKWSVLQTGNIIKAPVPAAMTPRVKLVAPEQQSSEVYTVNTSSLALRAGPGTNYKYYRYLKRNTKLVILKKTTSAWYEVLCPDGKRGYVSSASLVRVVEKPTQEVVDEVVEPKQLREQPFRIYRVVSELDKISVYARHISYDLMDNMVKHYAPAANASGATVCEGLLAACQTEHDFKIFSDLSSTSEKLVFDNTNPIDALLGEEGLAKVLGGELTRDWYDIYLVNRVGSDTNVTVRYGKNLLGISYDVDDTNAVTRIVPTGETKDGKPLYLDELYIDSAHVNEYPHPKWYHLAVEDAKVGTDGLTVAQAKNKLRQAAQKEFENGCDLPDVTLNVEFIDEADTEEYAQYKPLMHIFLGDSVRVVVPKFGLTTTLRMTNYTYDCLLRRYTKMTLGQVADTLVSSTITGRQIASGSISGSKLAPGSVGAGQLMLGSVNALHIQNAAIDTAHIVDASVTNAKIALLAVDSAQIKDAAITAAKIADAAITKAKIANAAIETAAIEDAAITAAKIADAAITKAKIANAAIGTAQIEDAAITAAKIGDAQISSAKIGDAAITTAHIALGAITMALIAQGAVGTAQIADASITDGKIVELTANKINAGTLSVERLIIVGSDKSIVYAINSANDTPQLSYSTLDGGALTQRSITADRIVAGAITSDEIAAATILANNIAAGAVTTDKLAAGAVETTNISAAAHAALKIAAAEYVDEHGVHTSSITLDNERLEILSTGIIKINAGARFDLSAGAAPGEYMGIHNTDLGGEFAIFTGADDPSGSNGRFRVNHNGEAWLKDAHVSGSLEVTHNESGDTADVMFGENVSFDIAESAARNFLRAIPLQLSREHMRMLQGNGAPTDAYVSPQYGDRYTQISPVQDYADYTFAPALTGFSRVVTQPQKRIQKNYSYYRTAGPSIDQPADYTTDSGYTAQGSATLGEPTSEEASCYVSGVSYSSVRTSQSTTQKNVSNGLWSGLEVCITTTYYRNRIATSHYVVTTAPIPTTGITGELDPTRFISVATAAFTRSITAERKYKLLTSSDAQGSTDRRTIGTITATGTALTFDIRQNLRYLTTDNCYLVIERDDTASDSACVISTAALTVSYSSADASQCEYVYNGQEWVELGGAPSWTAITPVNGTSDNTSYGNGQLRVRKVGSHVYVAGGVTITPGSSSVIIADLGYGVKNNNQYFIKACSGSRVARLYVNTGGGLYLEWVLNVSNGSKYTSSLWVDCNIDFWVD